MFNVVMMVSWGLNYKIMNVSHSLPFTIINSKLHYSEHISTNRTCNMTCAKIFRAANLNKTRCLLFTDFFECAEFHAAGFNAKSFNLSTFLHWIERSNFLSGVRIVEVVEEKANRQSEGSHVTSIFGAAEISRLRKLGTEQIRQVI